MGHRKSSSASVSGQKTQQENHQGAGIVEGRSEAPTLGQGTSNNSGGAGGNDIESYRDVSRRLEAERTALLRSKQAELDAIENRHDDLVRSCLLHLPPSSRIPIVRVGDSACVLTPIAYGLCRYAKHFI